MYQTTLPAKSSVPRRYDPVDDSMLFEDMPVVSRETTGQNQEAPQVEREGEPPGETETAELAFHEERTTTECAASSELSYLDLLSTGGLQDTCRQAIDEHSRGPRCTSGYHTSAVEVADHPKVDQPISEAVGGLEAAMQEPAPIVTGESVSPDAELDVTVDPLDATAVDAPATNEETWAEDWEEEGGAPAGGMAAALSGHVADHPKKAWPSKAPAMPPVRPTRGSAATATDISMAKASVRSSTNEAVEPDLWSAPTVTGKPMPTLPPKGSIAALGIPRAAGAPERIGSGRLVAARLTWKPREASAPGAASRREFRWDTMLTAACVTAACGIGCIWLLRAILA